MTKAVRNLVGLALLFVLTACGSAERDLAGPVEPLGAFKLGHTVVVTSAMRQAPISRDVTEEEWKEAVSGAVNRRFQRFEGDQFYHIAISVEQFSIAPTGIPLVAAPKSLLAIGVTIWDDAAQAKINPEPEALIIWESLGGNSIIGSGATMSKDEQVAQLAANAARRIESWMRENEEWFAAK